MQDVLFGKRMHGTSIIVCGRVGMMWPLTLQFHKAAGMHMHSWARLPQPGAQGAYVSMLLHMKAEGCACAQLQQRV